MREDAGEKVLSEIGLSVACFGNDEVMRNLFAVVGKIRDQLNRKSRGASPGSFNRSGGEEKSPYEGNCIMSLQNMLDASPAYIKRLHNAFDEPFLSSSQ